MNLVNAFLTLICISLLSIESFANDDIELLPLKGMASAEFGRIEEVFIEPSTQYDKESIINGSVWFFQDANLGQYFQTHFGVGVMTFSVIKRAGVPNAHFRRMVPVLARASGNYTLGGHEQKFYPLKIEVGYFGHKYNSYATNLGEYMFRTRIMPIQVRTGGLDVIETAGAFLTGFHADGHLPGGIHWDAFYNYNMDRIPMKAQSFTLMVDYNHNEIFEFGMGIQFQNIIYDNDSLLSPESINNMTYETSNGVKFSAENLDEGLYKICPPDEMAGCADSVLYVLAIPSTGEGIIGRKDFSRTGINPVTLEDSVYVSDTVYTISDSSYYSFAGTKLMFRAAFNLQSILQLDNMNPKDLSIYVEAIILGLESVPIYGETIKERMPIMFGINLPTFKLLDKLSFEMEVLKLAYPMNDNIVQNDGEVPNYEILDIDGNYSKDDWKFSLFAKKTIVPGLEFYFQVARDHMRTVDFWGKTHFWEVTQRNGDGFSDWGDWYWLTRFKFYF